MADPDPETLLEWLNSGVGDERDMQLIALEQLCMLLLMSDNVDRCFESCPPRTFLPALCRIFLDEQAPENILEVTARAITYYLDVSAECTRRIVAIEGAIKAICNRLVVAELSSRTSKDLAEQCVKVRHYFIFKSTKHLYFTNLKFVHTGCTQKTELFLTVTVYVQIICCPFISGNKKTLHGARRVKWAGKWNHAIFS